MARPVGRGDRWPRPGRAADVCGAARDHKRRDHMHTARAGALKWTMMHADPAGPW